MYCQKCGNALQAGQAFCPRCGARLNGGAAPGYNPGGAPGYAVKPQPSVFIQNMMNSLRGLGSDVILYLSHLGLMLLSFIFVMCHTVTVKVTIWGASEKRHFSIFNNADLDGELVGLRILMIFLYLAAIAVTLLPLFMKKKWGPLFFLPAKVLGASNLLWLFIFVLAVSHNLKEGLGSLNKLTSVHLFWTGWFFLLFTLGFIALSILLTISHKKKTGETLFTMLGLSGGKRFAAPGGYYSPQPGQQPGGYYPPQPGQQPGGYYPPQPGQQPGGYYPPQPGQQPGGYYPPQPGQPSGDQYPSQPGQPVYPVQPQSQTSYYPPQPDLSNGYHQPAQGVNESAQPASSDYSGIPQQPQYPTNGSWNGN